MVVGTIIEQLRKLKRALLVVFVGYACAVLFRRFKKIKMTLEYNKVFPAPNRLRRWILGHVGYFAQDPDMFLHKRIEMFDACEKEFGKRHDTINMYTPMWRTDTQICTRDPVFVKHILKDDFDSFVKPDVFRKMMEPVAGKGFFAINHGSTSPEHAIWMFQRKTAAKIFTKQIFNGLVYDSINANLTKVENMIDEKLENKESEIFGMKRFICAFTLDTISKFAMGKDLNTLDYGDVHPFALAFQDAITYMLWRLFLPAWQTLKWVYPSERRMTKVQSVLDDFTYEVIADRRKDKTINEKGDLLSLLLVADSKLSDKYIKDLILNFLAAGRDTTACTIMFALYLLSTHPEAQDILYEELDRAFPDGGRPNLDKLKELRYLDAVIFESLRLFAPVPVNTKYAARDSVLPDGTIIKKNTTVNFEAFLMGRDETRYKDAGSFKPERWLGEGREVQSFDQYEFPVFAGGPRICIGKNLAFYEAKMTVTSLLLKYKFSLPKEEQPKDWEVFRKDVALLNGKPVYHCGLTLSFNGPLNLEISHRR